MKKFLFVVLFFIVSVIYAQPVKNNLFEYATGTWCSSCACGHLEINENIAPNFPNTVFIAYHSGGADPFSQFSGNEVLNEIGFGAIPAAIVDRLTPIIPVNNWMDAITDMSGVAPTVTIEATTFYNVAERKVAVDVAATPLIDLDETYYISLVLLEDNIISPQTGSEFCPGGENFVHNNVARDMLNGSQGEQIWSGGTWYTGTTLDFSGEYIISEEFNEQNCRIAVIIYKHRVPLQKATVLQAEAIDLIDGATPVELSSFDVEVKGSSVVLEWSTSSELNNKGFEILKSEDGIRYEKVTFIPGSGTSTELIDYSYSDKSTGAGNLWYSLAQIDYDGKRELLATKSINIVLPGEYFIAGNYPNPFNPSTKIKFHLPEKTDVIFSVFNVTGELIKRVEYSGRPAGENIINFTAGDYPSGMYLYEISSSFGALHGKMILNK